MNQEEIQQQQEEGLQQQKEESKEDNYLYYTTKSLNDEKVLLGNARIFIDIVPIRKQSFDVISLVQFLDCITENFICTNKAIYLSTISLFTIYENIEKRIRIEFKIQVKKDFEFINVSARGTIAQLNPKYYDGFLCFPLLPFSIQQQNCPFYSISVCNYQFQFKNSDIFIFGKYIASNYKNYPLFLKYAFMGFLHKKTLTRRNNLFIKENLYEIFKHLPGYVFFSICFRKFFRKSFRKSKE